MEKIQIAPVKNDLGCFIDLNLSKTNEEKINYIKNILNEFGVVFFKNQNLDPKSFVKLAKNWGELADYPMLKGHPEYPEITVVERKLKDTGSNFGGEFFHTDSSYTINPPRFTFLMGVEVPKKGLGNTLFANQYLAYKKLPEKIKEKIKKMKGIFSSAGPISVTRLEREKESGTGKAKDFIAEHNLIKKIGNKSAIYCSPGHVVSLKNCIKDEIDSLKNFIFKHQTRKDFIFAYEWEKGDVVLWDNRSIIHKASAFNGNRKMYRITVL